MLALLEELRKEMGQETVLIKGDFRWRGVGIQRDGIIGVGSTAQLTGRQMLRSKKGKCGDHSGFLPASPSLSFQATAQPKALH